MKHKLPGIDVIDIRTVQTAAGRRSLRRPETYALFYGSEKSKKFIKWWKQVRTCLKDVLTVKECSDQTSLCGLHCQRKIE
jgi:hypothetical protein